MSENLYYGLSLFLILPLGFLYYFPIRNYLRHPIYILFLLSLGYYTLCFFTVPYLIDYSNSHNVLIMLPVLVLYFVILHINTTVNLIRSIVLFLWAGGFVSFASAFTRWTVIYKNLDGFSTSVSILRMALSILMVVFVLVLTWNWNEEIVADPNVPEKFWLSFLALPAILFYQNISLIAYRTHNDDVGEIVYYILLLVGNFVLYALISNVFYSNASLYLEAAKIQDEKRILELQESQYSTLTKTVEYTKKTLHDFKHTLNTLKTLAQKDNAENILGYLDSMNLTSFSEEIMNYCKHAPVNSVLNHYALRAKSEDVPLNLQVDLPEKLPMEDYEICSLIGNLMENAIDATKLVKKENRYFSFSIVMQDDNLIIVSSNSFFGKIKKSGEDFLSTKHSGYGIGIRSVKETVLHHGGVFKIHHDKNNFYVDIMISYSRKDSNEVN